MIKNQTQLPAFWIFHNKSEESVLAQTAGKTLEESQILAEKFYPAQFAEWVDETGSWEFAIFQLIPTKVFHLEP